MAPPTPPPPSAYAPTTPLGETPSPLVGTSPKLAALRFAHGFSNRAGASDVGVLAKVVGVAPEAFFQVTQVHGADVVQVGRELPDTDAVFAQKADALVARAGGHATIAVGVRVADCVPILVGDNSTGDVAAIHAGWRGVVSGVAGQALAILDGGRESRGPRLVAAIGPCIGTCCFEVGTEVASALAQAVPFEGFGADPCILQATARPGDEAGANKAFVNLRGLVRRQLRALGLDDEAIDDVGGCTVCHGEALFSFRREGARAGRQMGFIATRSLGP